MRSIKKNKKTGGAALGPAGLRSPQQTYGPAQQVPRQAPTALTSAMIAGIPGKGSHRREAPAGPGGSGGSGGDGTGSGGAGGAWPRYARRHRAPREADRVRAAAVSQRRPRPPRLSVNGRARPPRMSQRWSDLSVTAVATPPLRHSGTPHVTWGIGHALAVTQGPGRAPV